MPLLPPAAIPLVIQWLEHQPMRLLQLLPKPILPFQTILLLQLWHKAMLLKFPLKHMLLKCPLKHMLLKFPLKHMLLKFPLKHMLLQLLVKLLTNLLTLAHKLSSLKLSSLKLYNPLMFKLNH